MDVEVIAIGDEVLSGLTVNSNAAFISKALVDSGWQVVRHAALPDEPAILKAGLQEALARSSIVITTGGLGPTCDDLTRGVVAEIFHSDFHVDAQVAADLKKRYGEGHPAIIDQATVPVKAEVLLNRVGTAPGLIFRNSRSALIVLPGVPPEMQAMLMDQVIPYLHKTFGARDKIYSASVHLCLLSENRVDPLLRELKTEYPSAHIGIYPAYGTLTVHLSGKNQREIETMQARVVAAFPTHVLPVKSGKIEEAIHELFIERKLTLALAESVTGGMMAERLTSLPGASDYFLGSLVVYSNRLKEEILGVSAKTLREKGAVSSDAAAEMLLGLFKVTGADYGIAITGIAGPTGGTPEKPVGTVWAAIGERGKTPEIAQVLARGNRQTIILMAANRSLAHLWRKIAHKVSFTS